MTDTLKSSAPHIYDPLTFSDLADWGEQPDCTAGPSKSSGRLLFKGPNNEPETGLWVGNSAQHVDVAQSVVHHAGAFPSGIEMHAGARPHLDHLAIVPRIGRATGDEMAELVARNGERPSARRHPP